MTRLNKTDKNLQDVWDKLDNACGEIDNAMNMLNLMTGLPKELIDLMERIDFSMVVGLKNEVEELIDKTE